MNIRSCIISVLATFGACHVAAQTGDHLEPVEGYFSSYDFQHPYLAAVRELLVRHAVQSPAAMVTLASFQPERIVFLLSRDRKMFVVSATVSERIWASEKIEKITVARSEKMIRAEVAHQISTVFALATSKTRYPKDEVMGLDGVSYYFSAFSTEIGMRAGRIWSPPSESPCGLLVRLGDNLHRFVRGDNSEAALQSEAEAVFAILKKNA